MVKGRGPGKPFGPGNPPKGGSQKGRRNKKPSELLDDFRWVYKHEESEKDTPGQRKVRQLQKDDPKGFMAQLSRMEAAFRAESPGRSEGMGGEAEGSGGEEERGPDGGEERVVELIDRLLGEWEG